VVRQASALCGSVSTAPYWPELNATERIWNYTRKHATHNRFFEKPNQLRRALFRTFGHVQRHPRNPQSHAALFLNICRITYVRIYSYNDIIKVPSAILEKLRDHRIQTDSLLATKRYFVESDKVLLR